MEPRPANADRRFAEFRRSGDPRALGEVYDELAPELLRLAVHLTRDAAEAEDVLQATFVVAIEEARRFDPTRAVRPWLVGVLAHEARKARARAARRPDPVRVRASGSALPSDAAEEAELVAHLDAGLERVPAAFRPVVQLRLRHGLGVTEIAAVLECPPGTVRSQLARGIEHLRRALPAGLVAGVLASAPTGRGLAAVRAELVRHAAVHGPAAAASLTAAAVLGGLVMKKLAVLALVLLSAALVWHLSLEPGRARAAPREAPAEVVTARPASVVPESPRPVSAELAEREPAKAVPLPAPSPQADPATSGLDVRARWPDGTPAAGEIVLVFPRDARPDEGLALATDPDGLARYRGLEPGWATVRLLRGGEGTATLVAGRTAALALDVLAGVTVVGHVADARGEPVAGAEVWLSERYRNDLGHVVTHADARGDFELRSLGPDHYVGARQPGFAPSALRAVRGPAGARLELELVLDAVGGALEGLVVDPAGRPVPAAWVLLGSEDPDTVRLADGGFTPGPPPARLRTDARGRFACPAAACGLQPVQVRAHGFAPLAATIEVRAGVPNDCRLVLAEEARLAGTVRGEDGRPVAGAHVQVGPEERFASAGTWSGPEGRFELDGLASGTHAVLVRHAEAGTATHELELVPGRTERRDFVLARTPRIAGRVVDARGLPRAGLVVVAMPDGDREQRIRSEGTDDAGRFALADLEDRDYLLWVQPPGGWRVFPLLEVERVRPGSGALELRLPDGRERGSVVLEVASAEGHPLTGAELLIWHAERRLWRTYVSGEDGVIRVEGAPPGTLELEVRHPEHPWKRLGEHRLAAGDALDLGRVRLDPSGRLRVRLRGLPTERLAAVETMLVGSSNHEAGVARRVGDLLTTGPLAPDEYTLVIGGAGIRQARRSVRVDAGIEAELEITLEACGTREVRLPLPASARRPRWIGCSLVDARGLLAWSGTADCGQDPPVVHVSAPAGTYVLRSSGPGLGGEIEVQLPPTGVTLPALVAPLALE